MDAKEAIEIVKENIQQVKELQNHLTGRMNTECQRDIDGFLVAISALEKVPVLEAENARLREKETPKEPTNKFTDIDEQGFEVECGGCPNCKMEVNFDDNEYCPYCGQKLNWSSDKE